MYLLFLIIISCAKPIPKIPEEDPCIIINQKEYCPEKPVQAPPPHYGHKIV